MITTDNIEGVEVKPLHFDYVILDHIVEHVIYSQLRCNYYYRDNKK